MNKKIIAFAVLMAVAIATPVHAEPVNRWWSGWGMGVSEYGWSGTDGSNVYITCDGEENLGLSVAIRGTSPKPKSDVIFRLNGQEVTFWTNEEGTIDTQSRVSINNLYFLFEELRAGTSVTLEFNGLKKVFPLAGSAKGLGKGLCE